MINVIAREATVTGNSQQPGYLEGYGVIDAEQVRELAETSTRLPLAVPTSTTPSRSTTPIPPPVI